MSQRFKSAFKKATGKGVVDFPEEAVFDSQTVYDWKEKSKLLQDVATLKNKLTKKYLKAMGLQMTKKRRQKINEFARNEYYIINLHWSLCFLRCIVGDASFARYEKVIDETTWKFTIEYWRAGDFSDIIRGLEFEKADYDPSFLMDYIDNPTANLFVGSTSSPNSTEGNIIDQATMNVWDLDDITPEDESFIDDSVPAQEFSVDDHGYDSDEIEQARNLARTALIAEDSSDDAFSSDYASPARKRVRLTNPFVLEEANGSD